MGHRPQPSSLLAGVLVTYGLVLTVVPKLWSPFAAKFTLPKTGWAGVYTIAIAFDVAAAVLAFFVLRRMKVLVFSEVPARAPLASEALALKAAAGFAPQETAPASQKTALSAPQEKAGPAHRR